MTATIDPILEACLGVNGAITANLVIDILQETNPMVSMFVLKGVHVSLMELCRTGELVRISDPGEEAVYLRVADTPEIVPPIPEIVPERSAYVPYPGMFQGLGVGMIATVELPSQEELEVLDIPEAVKQRMFPAYKPKEAVAVTCVGLMPSSEPPAEIPDLVRKAILHMRRRYAFVTTVFYSLSGDWMFVGDDMTVAEVTHDVGLNWELLSAAIPARPHTPAVYRMPLEGRS
ncbi:MAG: hypothetical protein ACR2IJ_08075 [Fluviibacter sp.]